MRFRVMTCVAMVMAACSGGSKPAGGGGVAPELATFSASPSSLPIGVPTSVTWTWTYAAAPEPAPNCTIDHGVGAVASGGSTSVTLAADTVFMLTCTSSAGSDTRQVTVSAVPAPVAPFLASFSASPSSVTVGIPTSVTWTWTYANAPTPSPNCTIDHGVGAVASGGSTSVTLAADTVFMLACTSSAGSDTRQVTVSAVPAPVAPVLTSFSASPSSVTVGVPTSVTWTWTYAAATEPAPDCTIDHGVGAIASGGSTSVTLAADTVFTLTCTNAAGSDARQVTVLAVPAPVAPVLASFSASPSSVTVGLPTSVTWTWTYANTPTPSPTCSIDQVVGPVASGGSTSVTRAADTVFTLTCTNAAGSDVRQVTVLAVPVPVPPVLASFPTSPSSVTVGLPTSVTWTWTYANTPTPSPTCSIDQGVGPVASGGSTSVTLAADTVFTLTCTNGAGSDTAQSTLKVSTPAAPVIASFAASPSALGVGAPANVTWTWGYANAPSPEPACSIDFGVGTLTSGTATAVTLSLARTYQLTCRNSEGSAVAETTLGVDECAAGVHNCDANAQCIDDLRGFSCQCNAGYTGSGYTCSTLAACNVTPTLCDAHATCTNTASGYACVCRSGYVGDGTTCQRLLRAFTTSTLGFGNLSAWADAGGKTGLAGGDAICQARASAAGSPGTYVAWLSDSANDAFCRVKGLTGTKAGNCNLASAPSPAGPWARVDGLPFAETDDKFLAPSYVAYYPAMLTEFGAGFPDTVIFTGTGANGALLRQGGLAPCQDWMAAGSADKATTGLADATGVHFTYESAPFSDRCNLYQRRLLCFEAGSGPALPHLHANAKKAFITSVSGTGDLSSWADAAGLTGLQAADAVCRARARSVGLANAQTFKAWLSDSGTSASARITSSGPWTRMDGVTIATGRADLLDGALRAPLSVAEDGTHVANLDVWTATNGAGAFAGLSCSDWSTGSVSVFGTNGNCDVPGSWTYSSATSSCNNRWARLYCFED